MGRGPAPLAPAGPRPGRAGGAAALAAGAGGDAVLPGLRAAGDEHRRDPLHRSRQLPGDSGRLLPVDEGPAQHRPVRRRLRRSHPRRGHVGRPAAATPGPHLADHLLQRDHDGLGHARRDRHLRVDLDLRPARRRGLRRPRRRGPDRAARDQLVHRPLVVLRHRDAERGPPRLPVRRHHRLRGAAHHPQGAAGGRPDGRRRRLAAVLADHGADDQAGLPGGHDPLDHLGLQGLRAGLPDARRRRLQPGRPQPRRLVVRPVLQPERVRHGLGHRRPAHPPAARHHGRLRQGAVEGGEEL